MQRHEQIELTHDELLTYANLRTVLFNHEHDSHTPTGIRAYTRRYVDNDDPDEAVNLNVVQKRLWDALVNEIGAISQDEERRDWTIRLTPTHRWGIPNEDGNRPSVYEIHTLVTKSTIIKTTIV